MSQSLHCKHCNLYFKSKKEHDAHSIFSHKVESTNMKKILILGGGFGAITTLIHLQKKLKKYQISIVSEKNYFMFTPMLPQVASGVLHPSNISIPIRNMCKNSKFFQANVELIDIQQKQVTIERSFDKKLHTLEYDYLIVALGSKTHFFSNSKLENNSFPIKTMEDALAIRNHVLLMLEHADQTGSIDLQKLFLTFVVVGGGFAGVETIGEINQFIRNSVKKFYPNINEENIKMILISSKNRILTELNEKIVDWTQRHLEAHGITILRNLRVNDIEEDYIVLSNGEIISTSTVIWTGGVKVESIIKEIKCEHDDSGRIQVNEYLQIPSHQSVFVLGDCAAIMNKKTKNYYPSTAQHAIKEGKTVSENIIRSINNITTLETFSFDSLGTMAVLGDKAGIANILGYNIKGFSAWLLWRCYYLLTIPTLGKKSKIMTDWLMDMLFDRELTLLSTIKRKNLTKIYVPDEIPSIKDQILSNI